MNKLNGWLRIGIVLSVLWITASGIYVNRLVTEDGMKSMKMIYSLCINSGQLDDSQAKSCSQKAEEVFEAAVSQRYTDILGISLIPLPIFWILAYLIFYTGRWIKRGFTRS